MSPSSQEAEDKNDTIPALDLTAEADQEEVDYVPQEPVDIHEINQGKKPRSSIRPIEKPKKYGQSETLSTDEDTDENRTSTPVKGSTSIAKFQPEPRSQDDSTPGRENNPRDPSPLPGQTQKPTETEPVSPMTEDRVFEICAEKGRRREGTRPPINYSLRC